MSVIVIGDISHVVINVRLVVEHLRRNLEQFQVKNFPDFRTRIGIMHFPNNHRNATDFAFGDPT